VAQSCEKYGTALLLDISQCAGAMKLDIRELGAAMAVCSGYKWLLGPYGSGFFWIANDWVERLTLGSVYFMALEGARNFHALPVEDQQPVRGARRWDSAETANFTNLTAFDSSLDLLSRIGTDAVAAHIRSLVGELIERLPGTRCRLASPEECGRRGPYVCVSASNPGDTDALYGKLRSAQVHVSLRENAMRISPHIYNTREHISRLVEILSG
jgi:selenocysteine lyase/cysteine desulfurase